MRRNGLRVGLLAIALALLLLVPAADAAEPIEGTWTRVTGGGRQLFEATGGGTFKATTVEGVVERRTCFPNADGFHPPKLGEQNTDIRGSGLFYTGTTRYRRNTDCAETGRGQAFWAITSTAPGNFRMLHCSAPPGRGAPRVDGAGNPISPTVCTPLVRVGAPDTIKSKEVFKLPKDRKKRKCGTRKLKVAVSNPKNDPLVSLTVSFGGTTKKFKDTQIKKKVLVGRQPQKAFKVVVKGVTASGKTLKRTINYKKCIKRKRG